MELFEINTRENLLPYEGTAIYYGKVLQRRQSEEYFHQLMNTIEWRNDEAIIFGRHIITKRKVAWYAGKEYSYTYSNITKQGLVWNTALLQLKSLAEKITGETYNSCLLNLYHNGDEGMAWHSDDEKTLAKDSAIASLSFGAERKFSLRHKKTKQTISLTLEDGSLLVMKHTTQTHWLHCLPKQKKILKPRINLTFRTMAV